jgi:hypothetical protein
MERKFRAWSLPTGVSFEDLPQYWSELNFGEPKPEAQQTEDTPQDLPEDFDYSKFRLPDEHVQILRDLARSGREFSEMLEKKEAGRKKIVLGEPYDISDREIETYKTEEDRDIEEDVPAVVELPESSVSVGLADAPASVMDDIAAPRTPSAEEDFPLDAELEFSSVSDAGELVQPPPVPDATDLAQPTNSLSESPPVDGEPESDPRI